MKLFYFFLISMVLIFSTSPIYAAGDLDGDGVNNTEDYDDDDDGIPDYEEIDKDSCKDKETAGYILIHNLNNCTGNGCEFIYCKDIDTDGDGKADRLDLDSDGDGLFDVMETFGGKDYDHNGTYSDKDGKVDSRNLKTDAPLSNGWDDRIEVATSNCGEDSSGVQYSCVPLGLIDTDKDRKRDFQDADDDDDGLLTKDEHPDDNGDHHPEDALNSDKEEDDVPDYLDVDWDNDGYHDKDDVDDDDDGIADIEEMYCSDEEFEGAILFPLLESVFTDEKCDGNGLCSDKTMNCDFSLGKCKKDFKYCKDLDTDGDGIPDRLDLDSDGDGLFDVMETKDSVKNKLDKDHDGLYSKGREKIDFNYNGMDDRVEEGASYYGPTQEEFKGKALDLIDSDGDGKKDFQDVDDDGDKILTKDEQPDDNGNHHPEDAVDTDEDGVVDYLDPGKLTQYTSGNSMFGCNYSNNTSMIYLFMFILLALFSRISLRRNK